MHFLTETIRVNYRPWGGIPALPFALCAITVIAVISPAAKREAAEKSAVTAEELAVLKPRVAEFEFTEGDRKGETVYIAIREKDGRWHKRRGETRRSWLVKDDGGDVARESQVLEDKERRTVFDPPLLVVGGTMQSSDERTTRGTIRVFDIGEEEADREGEYTQTIRAVGWRTMTIAGRQFRAMLIEQETKFKFTGANVRVVTESAYAPGVGLIHQRVSQTIKKLKIFPDHEVETLRWTGETREGEQLAHTAGSPDVTP